MKKMWTASAALLCVGAVTIYRGRHSTMLVVIGAAMLLASWILTGMAIEKDMDF